MGTSLTGSSLTLNNTTLTDDRLKILTEYKNVTVDVGETVWLDGIECLCVATGVTIQGSSLTRIAVDKKYDLGYYQNYSKTIQNGTEITQTKSWRWGGYGTKTGNTSQEVGYGLKNTDICLSKTVNYTGGSNSNGASYPLMWIGVSDFRASHSDKWFVPSLNELKNYVYAQKSSLIFNTNTGGPASSYFWSSSEGFEGTSYSVIFSNGNTANDNKASYRAVRLCRAF